MKRELSSHLLGRADQAPRSSPSEADDPVFGAVTLALDEDASLEDDVNAAFDNGGRADALADDASSHYRGPKALLTACSLEPHEEYACVVAAKNGDRAACGTLIRSNMNNINRIARRYLTSGVPMDDLVSEGTIGVMTAVERFDASRGVRFSTYAKWWIRQAIGEYVMKEGRTVRLPGNVIRDIGTVTRALNEQRNDAEASDDANVVEPVLQRIAKQLNRSTEQIEHVLGLREATLSLEAVAEPSTQETDSEGIPNELTWSPESLATLRQAVANLYSLLGTLGERERLVLVERYGIETGVPATLDDLAKRLNVTAERVSQIQSEALTHLRQVFVERGLLPR